MFNKSINNIRRMVLIIVVVFCFSSLTACSGKKTGDSKNNIKPSSENKMKISWQQPVKKNDYTIIPGYAKADFGRFEFRWIIKPGGVSKLITLEPSGSSELPLVEKKVLPLVLSDGNTLLFQERPSLLNEKKPLRICAITSVSTLDLFSVFPVVKLPPSCIISKTSNHIKWDNVFSKNGVKYLQGYTKSSFGSLNLLWKKEGSRNPELVVVESPGAGELPAVETKLLPWIDEASGLTVICQERFPQLNQGYCSYLWCLTTVKTSELLWGFNLINSMDSENK